MASVPGDLSSVGTKVPARRKISTSRRRKNRVVVASQISGDGHEVPGLPVAKTYVFEQVAALGYRPGPLSGVPGFSGW